MGSSTGEVQRYCSCHFLGATPLCTRAGLRPEWGVGSKGHAVGVTLLSRLFWDLGLIVSCCPVIWARYPQQRVHGQKVPESSQGTPGMRAPPHTGVSAAVGLVGTAHLWWVGEVRTEAGARSAVGMAEMHLDPGQPA